MNLSHCIRTQSGKLFNPLDPQPDSIKIEDIAHALSLTCRWGGQCKTFYSVAQHSLYVTEIVVPELKLAALLHDASEAYLCDIPKPIKSLLPQYEEVETRLMAVIAAKFGFPFPLPPGVKTADEIALYHEALVLGPKELAAELPKKYPPGTVQRWNFGERSREEVASSFVRSFIELL